MFAQYLSRESRGKLVSDPGRYKLEDKSWVSAKLQVWWCFAASLMPDWLSANLITVGAAGPLALCYVVIAALWPAGTVPRWMQFLSGASVFFFQTGDAVDGKQARRLGTSSPLGDFLDHVVDSLCIMLSACVLGHCCQIQPPWLLLLCLNCASADFIAVHWESAKALVMTLDNGTSITEAQLAFIAVLLVEPLFGTGIWTMRIVWPTVSQIVFTGLVVVLAVNQIFRITLPRVHERFGSAVLVEFFAPVGLNAAVSLLMLLTLEGSSYVPLELFLIASTVLTASCVTLHRITGERIRPWFSLPIVLPALAVPLAPLWIAWAVALWALAFVGWFLRDVVLVIAREINTPVFASYRPKHGNPELH